MASRKGAPKAGLDLGPVKEKRPWTLWRRGHVALGGEADEPLGREQVKASRSPAWVNVAVFTETDQWSWALGGGQRPGLTP